MESYEVASDQVLNQWIKSYEIFLVAVSNIIRGGSSRYVRRMCQLNKICSLPDEKTMIRIQESGQTDRQQQSSFPASWLRLQHFLTSPENKHLYNSQLPSMTSSSSPAFQPADSDSSTSWRLLKIRTFLTASYQAWPPAAVQLSSQLTHILMSPKIRSFITTSYQEWPPAAVQLSS